MYSNGNGFTGNRFSKNLGGAAIMVSSRIELANNEFSFQQGSNAFGILLQESQQVHIAGNRFYQNLRGLYIDNSHDNRIEGNLFLHNKVGAEIWPSADKLSFTQNRFLRNTAPVLAMGDQGTNQWSVNGRGNVWDDQPLLDLNQDGIGDDPVQYKSSLYKLIQENELVYMFLSSPSISIYERINLLLNRQNMMVQDSYPLIGDHARFPYGGLAWLLLPAAGMGLWYGRRRIR
jgi:nitrous oxidase accessory protein